MPNFTPARLSQHLSDLALVFCVTGSLLSGSMAQAQEATTAASWPVAMEETATSAVNISPRQRSLIEELLTLTNQEALFDQTMAVTMNQAVQNMPALMEGMMGESPDPDTMVEVQAMMERIMGKILTGFQSRISFQEIAEDVYYPLYAKNFSEAQLQDMIDFYNTPTGQHSIEVMPALVQDSMALTQRRIMPTMIEVFQEVMAEEPSFQNQANRARQSEAKTYVGSFNRGQQAYFLEYGTFSDSLDALGIGVQAETENYTYQVSAQEGQPPIAVNLATPARDDLKAYAGFVFLAPESDYSTKAILCETAFPVSVETPMPSLVPTSPMECPAGFVAVN